MGIHVCLHLATTAEIERDRGTLGVLALGGLVMLCDRGVGMADMGNAAVETRASSKRGRVVFLSNCAWGVR